MSNRLRCALYTRKSSEEGLEQNFNSLHAQREACEAYVKSQAGEGWTALKAQYDDGGYSGGSMERPGLRQLLADISRGLVDVVVVYKVDRLTRSLADFAKIVELFDSKGVSFVSVTQAFNTTTSMGRLTLNVLLSFAQFEREVTGERIRDKIAASKAKGLRMGGRPPLGYDVRDGRLALNEREAQTVRHIFQHYLELGSVNALELSLQTAGVTGKRWTNKAGVEMGGGFLQRGPLYYLLYNPVYRGVTRHKEKRYDDTHPAIIDADLWDQVQAKLGAGNGRRPAAATRGEGALLDGLLFDDRGHQMVAVHTTRGAKRYRYYLSRPKISGKGEPGSLHRISAGLIEQILLERVLPRLSGGWMAADPPSDRIRACALRITLSEDQIVLLAKPGALSPSDDLEAVAGADTQTLRIPVHLRRRQSALVVDQSSGGPDPAAKIDRALVRAIVLAQVWAGRLERGEVRSVKELVRQENLCERYTSRLLPLAYLAPDLVTQIVEGRQPRSLLLSELTSQALPLEWAAQRRMLLGLG